MTLIYKINLVTYFTCNINTNEIKEGDVQILKIETRIKEERVKREKRRDDEPARREAERGGSEKQRDPSEEERLISCRALYFIKKSLIILR